MSKNESLCVTGSDLFPAAPLRFAKLWEIDEEEYWGYITTCGTEGNLHGILTGRENLPDGILYASQESHYSVFKAARMYRMDAVKVGGTDGRWRGIDGTGDDLGCAHDMRYLGIWGNGDLGKPAGKRRLHPSRP